MTNKDRYQAQLDRCLGPPTVKEREAAGTRRGREVLGRIRGEEPVKQVCTLHGKVDCAHCEMVVKHLLKFNETFLREAADNEPTLGYTANQQAEPEDISRVLRIENHQDDLPPLDDEWKQTTYGRHDDMARMQAVLACRERQLLQALRERDEAFNEGVESASCYLDRFGSSSRALDETARHIRALKRPTQPEQTKEQEG